jgi:hypothetical protein
MKRTFASALLTAVLISAWVTTPTLVHANDYPMTPGEFWEVTGVHLKDGGGLAYANFLASQWKADQEFAKSKGWIKGYKVLANAYPRKGEPDLFLIVISDRLATGPESDKRNDEYLAWTKKSMSQLSKESGNRLEIREIESNTLLQEMMFK